MTSHAMISVLLSLDGCIIVNTKNMVINLNKSERFDFFKRIFK